MYFILHLNCFVLKKEPKSNIKFLFKIDITKFRNILFVNVHVHFNRLYIKNINNCISYFSPKPLTRYILIINIIKDQVFSQFFKDCENRSKQEALECSCTTTKIYIFFMKLLKCIRKKFVIENRFLEREYYKNKAMI